MEDKPKRKRKSKKEDVVGDNTDRCQIKIEISEFKYKGNRYVVNPPIPFVPIVLDNDYCFVYDCPRIVVFGANFQQLYKNTIMALGSVHDQALDYHHMYKEQRRMDQRVIDILCRIYIDGQ